MIPMLYVDILKNAEQALRVYEDTKLVRVTQEDALTAWGQDREDAMYAGDELVHRLAEARLGETAALRELIRWQTALRHANKCMGVEEVT